MNKYIIYLINMSKILVETGKPTNLKPDRWYEEFAKVYDYSIEFLKERDIMVDKGRDSYVIEQSAIRFYHEFDIRGINSLEGNQQFLEECKRDLKSLGIKISSTGVINLCSKTLQNGYLVSLLLREIKWEIYCFKKNVTDIYKQFKFGNYQEELLSFIKNNIGWRNKERDFDIYMEIKKGVLYQEIAEKLELTIPAISMINSKVQSSINNLKGRFVFI